MWPNRGRRFIGTTGCTIWRWSFDIVRFGEDARYQRLGEAGHDKPNAVVMRGGKPVALLDWKAKSSPQWWMNNRAFQAYLEWEKRWQVSVLVAFALFDIRKRKLVKFRFAVLSRATVTLRRRRPGIATRWSSSLKSL
jgi:hypothetical protein